MCDLTLADPLQAARLSAGAVVDATLAVAEGKARAGLAIARPPGHHAEAGEEVRRVCCGLGTALPGTDSIACSRRWR